MTADEAAREAEFRAATDALLPHRVRISALTAVIILGGFVAVDHLVLPPGPAAFRDWARLAFTPAYLILAFVAERPLGKRFPQPMVLLLAAAVALELGVLAAPLPPAEAIGVFPAMLFFAAFLPVTRPRVILVMAMFVVAFVGLQLLLGHPPLAAVIKHAGNYAAAGALAVVASTLAERLRRTEFSANQRLADANRRLEELDRMKSQFFTDVSHELRTPLTTALLALESDAPAPPAKHGALRPLRRLRALVEELLELARVDAGFVRPTGETCDVSARLAHLVEEFSSAFAAKRIELRARLSQTSARVQVGPDALDKIAVNLLGNALKYTPAGGEVQVAVKTQGGAVALEVKDSGPGIPADDLSRIFQRFVRLHEGAERGTGIGLALAKELTEIHGGRIECQSTVGQGATFRVVWPEVSPAADAQERLVPAADRVSDAVAGALDGAGIADAPPPAEGAPGQPLVLVVEDHVELAGRIAASLGPGFRTALAHDGQAGLARARELSPDLVIADVMMPGMDGLELVRRLRDDAGTRTVPVLMLTALAEREQMIAGLRAGADDYMLKPFDREMLRARVDALLRLKKRRDDAAQATRVLRTLCGGFALSMGCDAVVFLARQPDGTLVPAAWGGALAPRADSWGTADAPWAKAVTAGKQALLLGEGGMVLPPALEGVERALAAPLGAAGVLVALSREPRAADQRALDSLSAAALCIGEIVGREQSIDALAQSAEEQRRLAAAVMSGQDAERRRLARDLHDGTGQTLIAALLHLDLALRGGNPNETTVARSLVDQALNDVRAMSRDLHPPTLARLGLRETLRDLATSLTSERMAVSAEIAPAVPAELPAEAATALFRIAQAALANVARHARAGKAVVRLGVANGALVLEIEDNGIGFLPTQAGTGVGLISMRERTASLGGTLSVESAFGRGTTIRATVPLRAPEDLPLPLAS